MIQDLVRVILSNNQFIYGATKQQLEELRTKLTFDNPRYASALKFSRWGPPVTIPRYLTFYDYHAKENCMEVPLHFPLPFQPDSVKDERCKVNVSWPKLKVKLRSGQSRAFVSYLKNPEKGQVVLDTGEGKTILAYAIAAALKQKTLILVDRVAYTKPWYDDFQKAFGLSKNEIGLIKGNQFSIGKRVTIAFFQTLNNRDLSQLADEFGLIIHDESDTAAAPTRFAVVSAFKAKYRLAISGTVKRTDGLEYLHRFLFGDFSVNLQGQGKNILAADNVVIHRVETGFNCRVPMRWAQNDVSYDDDIYIEPSEELITDHNKLWALEAKDERSNIIKLFYIEGALKAGEVCLVLTHRVFHAISISTELVRRGYKCKLLYGETPQDQKDKIIDDLNTGRIQCIVSTFSYIKRGANMPRLTRGFALTQTANETELRQAIGRIRRANTEYHVIKRRGKAVRVYKVSKDKCVWYDFICTSIKPYRYQAEKRMKLWKDMGFLVKTVVLPAQFRGGINT